MKRASPTARYAAELVGTFFLVVTVGCNLHAGSIGAALSIGCVVAAMVCALGSVSGAHLNPAITLAVWLSRRSSLRIGEVLCFMLFQIFGGILGTFTYWGVIGQELRQRPLFPYSSSEASSLEAIYAWALCYVFLNVMLTDADAKEARFSRPANGVAVGFTVTAAVVAIGPISGCCLNPAVTLGSYSVGRLLLANNRLALCCPYTFAPFVGSILGAFSFFLVRGGARGRYGEEEEWPREPAGRPREAAPRVPSLAEAVRRRPEDLEPVPDLPTLPGTMDADYDEEMPEEGAKPAGRRIKGRGQVEEDDRYTGKSGVFESLQHDDDDAGPARSIEGWVIIVSGVHEEAQEDDVFEAFAEFGDIKNLHLNLDRRTGFVKGYAFIEYETKQEAESAIKGMDGQVLLDQKLSVHWAFAKPSRGERRRRR